MSKLRRSLLFLPGNNPSIILNGCMLEADSLIFDLEDAISYPEKDAARDLVSSSLVNLDFFSRELIVRINSDAKLWQKDLDKVVCSNLDTIMPTKVESVEQILEIEAYLAKLEAERKLSPIALLPLIETALGVENAFLIAGSSPRIDGILLGAEDLCADLACLRSKTGEELFYARTRLIMAAKARRIDIIDTPFPDLIDFTAFKKECQLAKSLGFTGKASISPSHLDEINSSFSPSEDEVKEARGILEAMAKAQGEGVISYQGKMIDAPIIKRAEILIKKSKEIARKS